MLKPIYIVLLITILVSCGSRQKEVNQTIEDLKLAIKGETMACKFYLSYANISKDEGLLNIQKLFMALSMSEKIHAQQFEKQLVKLQAEKIVQQYEITNQKKTTIVNIDRSIGNESQEAMAIYPKFIKNALNAKLDTVAAYFNATMLVEENHAKLLKQTLSILKNNKNDSLVSKKWIVCKACGETYSQLQMISSCELCKSEIFDNKESFYYF